MLRRWWGAWLALIVVVLVVGGRLWMKRAAERANRAAQQREVSYQAALRSYSDALKAGMLRQDVEAYLRHNGKAYRQMCCMESPWSNAWDDLTPIGSEHAPWFCEAHNVYVGFAFVDPKADPKRLPAGHDSDVLREVRIFHRLEGCL